MFSVGDYIKLGTYCGKIVGLYTDENGKTVIRVYFVKNAFQRNMPEYHEIDDTHEISKATIDDIKVEIGRYMRMLRESLSENFADVIEP